MFDGILKAHNSTMLDCALWRESNSPRSLYLLRHDWFKFLPGGFNQSITIWEVHQSPVPENFWRKSAFCFRNRIAESTTWLTALLSHVLQYQHATTCWWPAQRLALFLNTKGQVWKKMKLFMTFALKRRFYCFLPQTQKKIFDPNGFRIISANAPTAPVLHIHISTRSETETGSKVD